MPEQTTQANPELVKYISEAKKLGYENYQIREPLLNNGWSFEDIEKAFYEVQQNEEKSIKKKQKSLGNKITYVYKNSITIHLDSEILKMIEKRAKKNMLTTQEQIEDIIRRSCVNTKKSIDLQDNVDDLFLKLFSRKNCGRLKK